ncbi:MAG: ribokinase [Myxococcota bacterium]
MTHRSWDIVVVGGCNYDYLMKSDTLPKLGETLEAHAFQAAPGGKGANQAVAAARLGARVAMIGTVGADGAGEIILDRLRSEGVDTQHVARDPVAPTGVALVLVGEKGGKTIMTVPGANRALATPRVHEAAELISQARLLLCQLEVPVEAVTAALLHARQAGTRTVLDPAPVRPLSDLLLSCVDVIRPNAAEAEALTDIAITDLTAARRAARALQRKGVPVVGIEAGSEGNLLVWPDGECVVGRLPVESVDQTGAGDAFVAALAVAAVMELPWEEGARWANAAAALATTKLGAMAGLPTRRELEEFLRGLEGEAERGPTSVITRRPRPGATTGGYADWD